MMVILERRAGVEVDIQGLDAVIKDIAFGENASQQG
jgi:hypothetical protein